jgi:hypothetical protein
MMNSLERLAAQYAMKKGRREGSAPAVSFQARHDPWWTMMR